MAPLLVFQWPGMDHNRPNLIDQSHHRLGQTIVLMSAPNMVHTHTTIKPRILQTTTKAFPNTVEALTVPRLVQHHFNLVCSHISSEAKDPSEVHKSCR